MNRSVIVLGFELLVLPKQRTRVEVCEQIFAEVSRIRIKVISDGLAEILQEVEECKLIFAEVNRTRIT